MAGSLIAQLAAELRLPEGQIRRTVGLLDDGNTIPFIARYRKEVTGGLDEVQIAAVSTRSASLRALDERRQDVLRLVEEQGKLTDELAVALRDATTLQEVDDLYLPYRPKRRTRAMIARERGLEALADAMLDQVFENRQAVALRYLGEDVPTADDALAGARDIVAEVISEDAEVRGALRERFLVSAEIVARSTGPENDPGRTYAQYYDHRERVATLPPHRTLAINRGEREGALRVTVEAEPTGAVALLSAFYPPDDRSPFAGDLRAAALDGFNRLLGPQLERETRSTLTERAERHAIEVFALNLRPLLLQPPLRGRTVIGIDPGFRTGCKVSVVDETGRLLDGTTIYPHPPQGRWVEAQAILKQLVRDHRATIFAVGNGTAGKETESLVAEIIADMPGSLQYAMVDEAGASVYSVSEIARTEFPELDATARGAISIARRLQDPLAELVKVDPQAVGVGLYQHDVDQRALEEALGRVVESAVTFAGVDINTASAPLLSRVAGLNRRVAANIVQHREQHGKFRSRRELLRVPGLGPRAFEQAAGFLKVMDGDDALDRTFIHPESYAACRTLIARLPTGREGDTLALRATRLLEGIGSNGASMASLATELGIGEPTLRDMLENLARPGLDPRSTMPQPLLRSDTLSLESLLPGMLLQGTVRNVVDFGAFVDIGLKHDGLVHISELGDRFVRSPHEIVQVGQAVTVRVLTVDLARGRVGLSMRTARP